jgi:Ca2+-binding EF-hand superfamily protein
MESSSDLAQGSGLGRSNRASLEERRAGSPGRSHRGSLERRAGSPGRRGAGGGRPKILNISEDDLHIADHPGKGSIKIDDDELNAAFAFFDVDNKGRLTAKDMHARLSAFYPSLPLKEVKALITEPIFTKEVLRRLLENNQLAGFDPVKQAFTVYDPNNTGFVDIDTLKRVFTDLGFADITDEDVVVLVEASDVDGIP